MRRSNIQSQFRHMYRLALCRFGREYSKRNLTKDAIVFSPHFDDETLGCGGTIIKKTQKGAKVKIVFMTDGSKSHVHLMPEDMLRITRSQEGIAAAKVLGVASRHVYLLGFEETRLRVHFEDAKKRVMEILDNDRPHEVFIPYFGEEPSDHVWTNRIVRDALNTLRLPVIVNEFPIWLWAHWPWARPDWRLAKRVLRYFINSLFYGVTILKYLKCFVNIDEVLETKREALNQYRSQMARLIPNPRWLTLADVANGEFLDCFLQNKEFFYQYMLYSYKNISL